MRSEMSIIADQFDSLSAYSSKKPQVRRAVKVWEASFNAAAAGHRSIDNLWQWHCLVFVGLVVVLSAAAFTGCIGRRQWKPHDSMRQLLRSHVTIVSGTRHPHPTAPPRMAPTAIAAVTTTRQLTAEQQARSDLPCRFYAVLLPRGHGYQSPSRCSPCDGCGWPRRLVLLAKP